MLWCCELQFNVVSCLAASNAANCLFCFVLNRAWAQTLLDSAHKCVIALRDFVKYSKHSYAATLYSHFFRLIVHTWGIVYDFHARRE